MGYFVDFLRVGQSSMDNGNSWWCGWFVRHARVTIGGTSYDAFEESQDAPHARLAVKCRHEVHFRRARV
jgi:hypothetical protein